MNTPPRYSDDRDSDDGGNSVSDGHLSDGEFDQLVAACFGEPLTKIKISQTETCMEILQEIQGHIRENKNWRSLVDDCRQKLEKCPPGDRLEPTVLHWTVKAFQYQYNRDEVASRAIWAMIRIVLKAKPEFIEKRNISGQTPLHLVFESSNTKMRTFGVRLADIICKDGGVCREVAGRAIALPDNNGETCVHLAIKGGWEIASKLIMIAEESAFKQQRNISDEDKNAEGGGNTPLHDAVAYRRCVFTESCSEDESAKNSKELCPCEAVMKKFYEDSCRVEKMIHLLVQKYDKALTIKNDDDETPYLHLLRTRKDYKAAQSKSSTSCSPSTNASALTMKPGQATSRKATPQPMDEPATHRRKSTPPELLFQAQPVFHRCGETIQVDNERLAETIEKYLVESAFAIGGFEDACASFFSDRSVKDGKHAPFRPGYPIFSKSHEIYSEIIRPENTILPHVHLEVGSSIPEETEAEKTTSDEVRRERRRQQIENDWQDHMGYLVKVFEMLKKRGVKRVLKVTVKDNPDRPCRDNVIIRCLSDFDVRYLDWQKNDLCIDVVLAAAPRVSKLTLYSSGNTAVLRGWEASQGLCSLNQLTNLTLVAHMGLEEKYKDYETNVNSFVRVVTENIAMTRWKVLLKAEKQEDKTCQLERLLMEWDILEERRRPQEVTTSQTGGAEATDAQSGTETWKVTPEFLRLDPQRSAKVFLTSDAIRYAAWKFTFEPPVLDLDPLPKENAKTGILNNALEQRSAGASARDETMNTWLGTVSKFLETNCVATDKNEVKVALIDDGVDLRQFDGQIHHEGWPHMSFNSDEDPWFKSTNEHGTRMAQLILSVCPKAKLYVAKLVDWKHTEQKIKLAEQSTTKNAAEAVKWARQKNVQIISMSWCLVQNGATNELEEQIRKAASENIIMFCAAADKARYDDGQKLYPKDSDTQRLMVVGSAKENGEPSEFVDPNQAKVLFPGENIQKLGESRGSSAATALASGLTALILWCLEREGKSFKSGHADRIFKLFGNLKPNHSNWVNVHKLLKYHGDIQSIEKVAELCISWSTT